MSGASGEELNEQKRWNEGRQKSNRVQCAIASISGGKDSEPSNIMSDGKVGRAIRQLTWTKMNGEVWQVRCGYLHRLLGSEKRGQGNDADAIGRSRPRAASRRRN